MSKQYSKRFLVAGLILGSFALPATAQVDVYHHGKSAAQKCAEAVRDSVDPNYSTLRICRSGSTDPSLSRKNLAATLVNTGIMEMRAGNFSRAKTAFQKARRHNAELNGLDVNLSALALRNNQPELALDVLSDIDTVPDEYRASAFYNRALAHLKLNEIGAATTDLKTVQTLGPDHPGAETLLEELSLPSRPFASLASVTVQGEVAD